MKERRKKVGRRKGKRRRLLTEDEFRKLIEQGKVSEKDRRSWVERRRGGRRRRRS